MKQIFRLSNLLVFIVLFGGGCASKVLQYEDADVLETNEEYDKKIQIKEIPPPAEEAVPSPPPLIEPQPPKDVMQAVRKKKPPKEVKRPAKEKAIRMEKRQPSLEDSEGFIGRRPEMDPYRVGEKVVLNLTYFNIVAGTLTLEVLPFVEVNKEKSYAFKVSAKSNSLFSRFYSVDDSAVTYVNYESLLPINFEITVRESKQLADIRSFFDWKKLKGQYWEKRVSESKGERNKNIEWEIKAFSQNVVSAVYYLRAFKLTPGKKLAFRVADEGKNIVFTGEVLRKETIKTDAGTFNTVVVQPRFEVDGVFKPVGDILLWLTDDDRKFLVRVESKIKIGTIIGKLKELKPGL